MNRTAPFTFALVGAIVLASGLFAQELRVDSRVFLGDETHPVSQNITLYEGSMAYDFQLSADSQQPVEIVIYNSRERSFVLLDLNREIKTGLQQFEVLKLLEGLRATSFTNEDVVPLVSPDFEPGTFDTDTGSIELGNDDIRYRATGVSPQDLSAMPLFYSAMDEFTRLSASDPERLPPFARLALNQEIKRSGLFPSEISCTIRPGLASREEIRALSRHSAVWRLSANDRQMIAEAKSYWMSFPSVSIMEYRGLVDETAEQEADLH